MNLKSLFAVFLLVASVTAGPKRNKDHVGWRDKDKFKHCARGCLDEMLHLARCKHFDDKCLCKSTQYGKNVVQCARKNCEERDFRHTRTEILRICRDAGQFITI